MNDPHHNTAIEAPRLAADPKTSVWVEASAGTGKTTVLTGRVIALMVNGTAPQKILCLTFTKAAAANMANRIADKLGQWTHASDDVLDKALGEILNRKPSDAQRLRARGLFALVLDAPGGLNIQTLHAFCQSLLGRFPLEAGIAPHSSVMDERDAAEMMAGARQDVLCKARNADESAEKEGLAKALSLVTAHVKEDEFSELMDDLARNRSRLGNLIKRHGSAEKAIEALQNALGLERNQEPDGVILEACSEKSFAPLDLRLALSALMEGSKTDKERAGVIEKWLSATCEERVNFFPDYVRGFLTTSQTPPTIRKTLITKPCSEKVAGAEEALKIEAARLLGVQAKWRAAITAQATSGILRLGEAWLYSYERQKKSRALLDYDDLILAARDLLSREGSAPWVLFKLDGGIDHILIDEAQDTSPEQWQVVASLAEEFFSGMGAKNQARTVFAVGDAKQSIYSFQGADPQAFQEMREMFAEKVRQSKNQWRNLPLTISFRSTKAVLCAVDATFAKDHAADGVALDGTPVHHDCWRLGEGGLVEVWPVLALRETDQAEPWKPPVEHVEKDQPATRLARLIAKKIKAMVDAKDILSSSGRPVRCGDIMVLVRRRTSFVDALIRCLKELNVAVAGIDRMVLSDQIAIMDLVALGRFVLLPEDDLMLATVLRSPLIGLSEDQLYDLAYGRSKNLWATLAKKSHEDKNFLQAYKELSELLALADFTPPFEFYSNLLGARNGRKKLVGRLGRDAEDPISVFLDLALAFERAHAPSLEGFLDWLERGHVEIKRDLEEEERDAVRVMTVHGAKGLQAPIVFLPDTLQAPKKTPRLLWPRDEEENRLLLWPPRKAFYEEMALAEQDLLAQRRDQEYRRLLYVAMTRAEDQLYVCGWRGQQSAAKGCWYELVHEALESEAIRSEDPFLAAAEEIDTADVLRLTCAQEKDPEKNPDAIFAPPLSGLPNWATRPPPPEPQPLRPLAPSRPKDEEPCALPPFDERDATKFKRGLIIHRLLQHLPDMASGQREAAAKAFLSQTGRDLSPQEQNSILKEVFGVLETPEFAALFGPGSRAEVPLTGIIGTQVVSAQIDRLLIEDESVTIIDYKTNRRPPKKIDVVPALYLGQLASYRAAMRLIYPEKNVCCLLLWTDGPIIMNVPDAVLDLHAP
jgi:ATP-dependent helicase/nuclease subunit A